MIDLENSIAAFILVILSIPIVKKLSDEDNFVPNSMMVGTIIITLYAMIHLLIT